MLQSVTLTVLPPWYLFIFSRHHVSNSITAGAGKKWQPIPHRLHQGFWRWIFISQHCNVLTGHNFFFLHHRILWCVSREVDQRCGCRTTSNLTLTSLQEKVSAKGNTFGKQTNPNTLTAAVQSVAAVKYRHVKWVIRPKNKQKKTHPVRKCFKNNGWICIYLIHNYFMSA